MTLTEITCLVKEVVGIIPFPLLMGILGASILSPIPFVLVGMKRWISDLGKYGVLFPYVWAACFIVLLLATLLDKNASVVPDGSKGWYSYVVILGVTMCFALVTYCGFFLLLCSLEVVSHHFRKFFFLWIFAFLLITLGIYITQSVEVEEGDHVVTQFDWIKRKTWGRSSNPVWVSYSGGCEDACVSNLNLQNEDYIDMRKCKTPAVYQAY